MHTAGISIMGRDTQGVIAMRLNDGDKVASIAKILSDDEILDDNDQAMIEFED
jgi:DNA gyrase/topoisomerase IV subunit A